MPQKKNGAKLQAQPPPTGDEVFHASFVASLEWILLSLKRKTETSQKNNIERMEM